MNPRTNTLVAALLATFPLLSQTTERLIGIAATPAVAAALNMRQHMTACTTVVCPLPFAPLPAIPQAGGTAYDARRSGVWMTNGTVLGMFDPDSCAVLCPPVGLGAFLGNALATGLALNENQGRLFLSDTANAIYVFQPSCPPVPAGKCQAPVPAGQIIGGLATSDVGDLVFYSSSFWAGAPMNFVTVAPQTTPCQPICRFNVPVACGTAALGPITGLAWDDCRRELWATDGLLEARMTVVITAAGCSVQLIGCCRVPGPERYLGLCIQPSQATSLGANCTSAPCPACPTMVHGTVGDPALGNPSFGLTLANAPANVSSLLVINAGPCGPGLVIPGFCGPLRVPLPGPITIGVPTGGVAGCTGGVSFTIAIPLNPVLCHITLSSQFLLVCPTPAGLGTGVSNCQSWMITGT